MAKFSKKMMGKEVGDASVYAKPHTMSGKPLAKTPQRDPNTLTALESGVRSGSKRVSDGDPGADDVKTSGIKIRGTGAATKGVVARGPMA
jgi:hypothetical protein